MIQKHRAGRSAHGRPVGRPAVKPPRRTRRRLTLWSGLLGVVLIGSSALLLSHDRSLPQAFGQVPGAEAPSTAPATTAAVSPLRVTSTSVASGDPTPSATPPTRSDVPAHVPQPTDVLPAAPASTSNTTTKKAPAHASTAAVPPGLPSRIQISTLHVAAAITQVTSSSGVLVVPSDPAQVGWWVGSALPGSATGTTVLDGHIDSATAGIGAFWQLSSLDSGDQIAVQLQNGNAVDYRVVARRVYPKNAGLPPSLFSLTGPPTLLMISCGGPFDSARGSYEDNIAVFATPSG